MSEAIELGPKMMALPERQRKFVLALFDPDIPPKGQGMHIMAARLAGYGKAKDGGASTDKVVQIRAAQLLSDKRVQAAIAEYSSGAIRTMAPDAVMAVRRLLHDRRHRDHAKVALAVLEKVDPTPRAPMVVVENNTNIAINNGDEMLERIKVLCLKHGIDADTLLSANAAEMASMRAKLIEAKPRA